MIANADQTQEFDQVVENVTLLAVWIGSICLIALPGIACLLVYANVIDIDINDEYGMVSVIAFFVGVVFGMIFFAVACLKIWLADELKMKSKLLMAGIFGLLSIGIAGFNGMMILLTGLGG